MENLVISHGRDVVPSNLPVEIVERKGQGHPDYLCDKAAEEMSIAISKWYIENTGRILHHNLDKAILAGGQSDARIGYGEILEPIYLLIVGRAVGVNAKINGKFLPIGKLVIETTKNWLQKDLPHLNIAHDIIIDYKVRSGSTDLVGNFEESIETPLANDTSIGIGYAPLTKIEQLTYQTERMLNDPATKKKNPAIGEDIKVMGVRHKKKIDLTIACAMICTELVDVDHYFATKEEVQNLTLDLAAKIWGGDVNVDVNVADVPGNDDCLYLTVTGTSAEQGDDGQVGRGNRTNGLITPYRPMTLEAAAGKNPVSHVGKTYNIAAKKVCEEIVNELSVENVDCYLVSKIGKKITEPQLIEVALVGGTKDSKTKRRIEEIVQEQMSKMPEIWRGFMNRSYELY
ncbi:MAG: methionine adenosyltransferase [Candidatus Heimdallarchaeota archaeon]|nr:methionine adenosyltransferase [Candidatus Heimdallarchaeota archaeon]MCK4291323.1 methionine adenosyltransferase [Candidatus Heimdallarchaeota archaeon]